MPSMDPLPAELARSLAAALDERTDAMLAFTEKLVRVPRADVRACAEVYATTALRTRA
jgi:alkylhydroperoxidase family enzyme